MVRISSRHYEFRQVSPDVWAALATDTGAAVANAAFTRIGPSSVVVDCGYTPAAALDLRAAAEQSAGPVAYLVLTHAHPDNYLGAQVFAGLPIVATETANRVIVETGPGRVAIMQEAGSRQDREIAAAVAELRLAAPTRSFTGRCDFGPVQVLECGAGHTLSDSVVWLAAQRVLIAGDLVCVDTHPDLRFGDPENWLRILDHLARLEPIDVVPGRGRPAGPESIATMQAYIRTVIRLAAERGARECPPEWAHWRYAPLFERNIAALRMMRQSDRVAPGI